MHPLKTQQPWPYANWWVAATSEEVVRAPLGRSILELPVIFYRTQAGEAVALHGVCPHRSYPLSMGCVEGDNLRCGYHGFAFAPSGECVEMPSQTSVPSGTGTLRRYPLVERDGLLWIWTGPADAADPTRILDLASYGLTEGWAVERHETIWLKCRYPLLIDNLLDLSHISYIHASTIPGGGEVVRIPPKTIDTPRSYNVQRCGVGLPSNPLSQMQFPDHKGALDRHFDAEYFGPEFIRTGGLIYAHESRNYLGTQNFLHLITPITRSLTRYQVISARDYQVDNPEVTNFIRRTNGPDGMVVSQDVEALEAIESLLQSLGQAPGEISCRVDTGALKVRNRLEAQIRAETPGAPLRAMA